MCAMVQIRDVPDDVHAELTRMAEEVDMSLNKFLLAELRQIALRGRNVDVVRRARGRSGPRLSTADIVDELRTARGE
jgi:hypothetical protein